MSDLSLIPLPQLCDEICNRSKTAIILVEMDDYDTYKNAYYNWVGDYYKALGFCEEMKDKIKGEKEC